jgi:hypothetical protein
VCSPASKCSSSAAVIDESFLSREASEHKDPEVGIITGRLNDFFNPEFEWHPYQAHALFSTPRNQMERTRMNNLDCSSARSCSLTSAVADASAFYPGASEYQEPETGSTRRLKDYFKLEVERCQSQGSVLVSTPSNQTTRARKNSLALSPAGSCSSSSLVPDASAFSPGASEYQEPAAGSTHRLKDLFEKKIISTSNPESMCVQTPTKKTVLTSTLADVFAKRSSLGNSEHVCE